MVQMVGFRIGDDGGGGTVLGEAAVGFVGLRHQHRAVSGMAAVTVRAVRRLDGAADGVAGVGELPGSRVDQDVGEQRAGGGLAVRASHGDGPFGGHQQGEDVAAVHDAGTGRMRRHDLRIVRLDGARIDHGCRAGHVLRALPELDRDAQRLQPIGFGAWLAVGSVDDDALLVQHLGQHAHAGAADADEMGPAQIADPFVGSEGRTGRIEFDGCLDG